MTFGSEKLYELLATFRSGSAADAALQRVYGFDQTGLQERWRISLGAAPFPDSAPETSQDPQVPVLPTFAPFSFATPPPLVATAVPSPSLTPTQPPSGGGLNCSPGPLAAGAST